MVAEGGGLVMDDRTITALKRSVEKWERYASAKDLTAVKIGSDSCPLCVLFIDRACTGCPVRRKTGKAICNGSPYEEAARRYWGYKYSGGTLHSFSIAAAAEAQFLRSLIPAEGATE